MTVVSSNPVYVGIRLALWIILWIAVHIDAYLRWTSRGRGWRLQRGILAFLTAQLVFQSIHFAVTVQYDSHYDFRLAESNAFKAEIFFKWLAQSLFLCLILLVSVGYWYDIQSSLHLSILREQLGDSLRRVIFIPIIYGLTSMTFDYVLLGSTNRHVVTHVSQEGKDEELDVEALKGLVLVSCLMLQALVFVVAWVFVFENLNREIRLLKGEEEEELPDVEEPGAAEHSHPGRRQTAGDNAVSPESEQTKTVADAVGDQAKLLLLTRFRTALVIYIISEICTTLYLTLLSNEIILLNTVGVNILPIYIGNSSVDKLHSITTVCENIILLTFITVIAWIFRPVGDNPYLLLMEFEENDEENKAAVVTTELGVMVFEPATPDQSTVAPQGRTVIPKSVVPGTFSLANEEDLAVFSPQTATEMAPVSSATPTITVVRTEEDPEKK